MGLRPDQLEKEMYVVSRGRVYHGFYGYRVIALGLPAFWLFVPWLYFPVISSLGESIYGFIASRRMNLLSCHSQCQIGGVEETKVDGSPRRTGAFRELRYSLSLSGIILVVVLSWLYHVEFYPFTSWDVYSSSDVSGKVTYLKVFGRDESGKIFRARLEDGIGAVSYDARYSRVIQKCFGRPADVAICKKFLAANAKVYNHNAFTGRKLTHYELQKWTWDFQDNPYDSNYGKLTDRFDLQINTGSSPKDKTDDGPNLAIPVKTNG